MDYSDQYTINWNLTDRECRDTRPRVSGGFATQNHIAVGNHGVFSFGKSENALHFRGTVVLSAADSNEPIAGGNRTTIKRMPVPTLGTSIASLTDYLK